VTSLAASQKVNVSSTTRGLASGKRDGVLPLAESFPPRLPDLNGWRIGGAICHTAYPSYIEAVAQKQVPMALVGNRRRSSDVIDKQPRVIDDHQAIGRTGAEHLLATRHQHWGYITSQPLMPI
jgi:DNA-binding LacI/PurR family transcriptional regulator